VLADGAVDHVVSVVEFAVCYSSSSAASNIVVCIRLYAAVSAGLLPPAAGDASRRPSLLLLLLLLLMLRRSQCIVQYSNAFSSAACATSAAVLWSFVRSNTCPRKHLQNSPLAVFVTKCIVISTRFHLASGFTWHWHMIDTSAVHMHHVSLNMSVRNNRTMSLYITQKPGQYV